MAKTVTKVLIPSFILDGSNQVRLEFNVVENLRLSPESLNMKILRYSFKIGEV